MTTSEETLGAPPVRHWPVLRLSGVDFDPVLAELMREGPINRIQLPNGEGWAWLLTRHDDVRLVTDDPRFSRAEVAGRQVTRWEPHFAPRPGAMTLADTPDHARLRRALAPAFDAPGIARLRATARRKLEATVDAMLRDGPPADLVARVLEPFAVTVVCDLMGVPEADREEMRVRNRRILSLTDGAEAGERAERDMRAYFATAVTEHRDSGGEDVVSLLGAAVGRGDITQEEASALAVSLQIGGEALIHNTGRMCFVLLSRPDLLARLREEPGLRPRAVEELLRYVPHRNAVGLSRIALEDVVLHGVRIRAGEPVYVSYLAANRDPEVFPDPERIDFDRDPNPHLAFGHGAHACVGAGLARLEAELVVDALLDRVPGLRPAVPPAEVRWRRGALIRGPEALPVTW
ncbi:cytochrome P450 [Streptomyces neyagawaensis]|uniref:cytochrome P450 n=1 Tax=Streptomyces neyagawaensis TaxID=42238 RepID=UPI0006E23B51|nr:cytochrome P450 [Streptomyces neyagawaensis]MCL6734515.1 cytochrome P450 [Streptomyces neyagawaensis]MDE1685629.1 cytochrome P450 [Streptomyces neyagawaensis]